MKQLFVCVVLLLAMVNLAAMDFYSAGNGNWFDPLTWVGGYAIPGSEDDVYILSGHTVNLDGASSITVNNLTISSQDAPAVLSGPYAMGCTIYVNESVNLLGIGHQATLCPGDYGLMFVQLGEDMAISGNALFSAERTTLTANSPDITNNKAQLGFYGNPQVSTIFDTQSADDIIEVATNISFPNGYSYGFENARLDMWDNIGFANCHFSNCTFNPRNENCQNTLFNCHLYSCTADLTMFFSGPVAMMDNGNVFYNLNLLDGGSLWGNFGSNSSVEINNNLTTQTNTLVSPGDYGNLDIFLAGDLSIGGLFYPTNLIFDGARDLSDPQEINQVFTALVRSNFSNLNSTLRLVSFLQFESLCQFYPGTLYLNNQELINAQLNNAVIPDGGYLSSCILDNNVFNGNMTCANCTIVGTSNAFNTFLVVNGSLLGSYGTSNSISVELGLTANAGSIIAPGDYGLFDIHLRGNFGAYGLETQFSPSNLYLDSPSDQYLTADGVTINANIIVTNTQELYLGSDLVFNVSRDKHFISYADPPTVVFLENHMLRNAILDGGYFRSGTLADVVLYSVKAQDVSLNMSVTLGNNGNTFHGQVINNAWLSGAYGTSSEFTSYGSFSNYNFVSAGEYGTMDAYCYGNVTDIYEYPNTWMGILHLRGTEPRHLNFREDIPIVADNNADFHLTGENVLSTFTIQDGSTITVDPGASLILSWHDDWYSGNLVMNGSFYNTRDLSLSEAQFHDLRFIPTALTGDYGTLTIVHSIISPANLPDNTGEYWNSYTMGNLTTITGVLVLHYRGEAYTNYRLYVSLDDGLTWTPHMGGSINDMEHNTISLDSVTLSPNMRFAISSVYDQWLSGTCTPVWNTITPLKPHFDWPDLHGGTAYHIEISNDEWLSVCYYGDVVSVSECDIAYALAPGTTYWWKVYATSSVLGDVSSRGYQTFTTRNAITCNLPASSAYLPGENIAFYLPAYIQNLLPGEALEVYAYSSAHLQVEYVSGTIIIIPQPGWTGSENIDLQIGDGFTILSPSINIVVLGTPVITNYSKVEAFGHIFNHFEWNSIPGATFYWIYSSDTPDGPWQICGWSSNNNFEMEQQGQQKFFMITANTGEMPRSR